MKKFIHLFIYLATLITLISCGDGIDSLNQNKIKTIKVDEDIVSQSFGLSVYEGIDQRDNKIRVYAIPDFIEDVVVEENVNYGTPPSFDIITNNFIRVRFPSEISEYHQTIRVLPSGPFDTVMVMGNDGYVAVTPFKIDDDGYVEIVVMPDNGLVEFVLVNR